MTAYLMSDAVIDPAVDLADTSDDAYPPRQQAAAAASTGEVYLSGAPPRRAAYDSRVFPTHWLCLPVYASPRVGGYEPEVGGSGTMFPAGELVLVAQQMIPRGGRGHHHATAVSAHLALAATSRAWNAVMYDMFYGENTFIFNVDRFHSVHINTAYEADDHDAWESWSRTYRLLQAPGPLGPLTSRAAKHLQTVFLLLSEREIKNSFDLPQTKEEKPKPKLIQNVVDILMASRNKDSPRIKQFNIHLAERPQMAIRDYLSVDEWHRIGYPTFVLKAGLCKDTGRREVDWAEPKAGGFRAKRAKLNVQHVAEKQLLRLRGCEHVSMRGRVTRHFVEEFPRVSVLHFGVDADRVKVSAPEKKIKKAKEVKKVPLVQANGKKRELELFSVLYLSVTIINIVDVGARPHAS
ncbi:hypothetical protein B0H63DRAFT_520368 [Podospora didyma]|uniref:Uncharacterized protein n=1 Tax=Podospora didyma TaxID=330526 RepID=A0AAE0P0T7_9PEZI|nr:hypothetical protein B0H63DRAFT_520368 [Podospora didyma]